MKIKNITELELNDALRLINERYNGNIAFNRYDHIGKYFNVTLKVVNANKKKGTTAGRKLNQCALMFPDYKGVKSNGSACWHVHGYFFEALLKVQPNAVIVTQYGQIDKNGGNWVDQNKGSLIHPIKYSELCECEEEPIVRAEIRTVQQSNLSAECWTVQFRGLIACDDCEFKDTDDCGGQRIRSTGKNSKGLSVPI